MCTVLLGVLIHGLFNLSSNRMGWTCDMSTPLPLELYECLEPLICRECGDTLATSYTCREEEKQPDFKSRLRKRGKIR